MFVRKKFSFPVSQMGSLKNNDILRCSYFSVTGIGVAGSLMLLEVVS